MANNIEYENKDLKYTNLIKPQVVTGLPLSRELYQVDENGKLKEYPDPLINAIDINWGGATIKDTPIHTTDDLLSLLNTGDFGGDTPNPDVPVIDNNSVIGIMLNAIRALQSEVARLRNSFRFGINSYTGENFGMSQTVDELQNIQEEEPLWATDESELSFVEGLDLSQQSYQYITPYENYELIPNDKIVYSDTINFIVPEGSEGLNILENLPDPKQYVYITCSTKDVDIILRSLPDENNDIKTLRIKCKDLFEYQYAPEKYNILVIVSKQVPNTKKDGTIELVSQNFIWVSVSEWGTGTSLFNGYISEDGTIDKKNSETPIKNKDIYNISEIEFHTTDSQEYIYKLDVYSKYQDMTTEIVGSTPTYPDDYKYRTAAITIRSMSTEELIKKHIVEFQNNELIYCEANKKLFIYTNGNLINIGGGGSNSNTEEDIMENYEILKALEEQGLINITFIDNDLEEEKLLYDFNNIKEYILSDKFNINATLNSIEKINFINGDTGKEFNVTMSPYGEFNIKEKAKSSMAEYIKNTDTETYVDALPGDFKSDRSFVSLLKAYKKGLQSKISSDLKLNADRIQIGAVYAPMKTDTIHGCTHGYIELTNSSDEDFYLDGCYLHYSYVDNASTETVLKDVEYQCLELDGYIPKGGTYLIRCKQYSTIDDPNTFINVATYDKEWYINGELLDLSTSKNCSLGLALTYGNTVNGEVINAGTTLAIDLPTQSDGYVLSGGGSYLLAKGMIDALYLGQDWGVSKNHWVKNGSQGIFTIKSNTIYKITFELDPAKQAFNSWSTKDSSRIRWQNSATDFQFLNLDREFIEFPKTDIKKPVADYTPKASFEHKNVMTDKTQLDKTKPNAIVCSFGINPYTTRCFNWVSSGSFDEAVVLINPHTNDEYIFESYKNISTENSLDNEFPRRKEFSVKVNNIVYGSGNIDETNGERLYNKLPGNDEPYTSHKCIIDIVQTPVSTPETWNYYVCRLNKYGQIDQNYKSELRSFTLYPQNYSPRIYQVTDQQGFHWIEYQVWAASAKKLNELIIKQQTTENIMPIIINTGDCVQSGARINEWLDYFIAGDYLFSHYEQMNVVGNNDLCDTNINILGTGDDTGKSNGYFFHLFNCYEIPQDEYCPIINDIYVPSLYYMDINTINGAERLLFINSEITTTNCRDWFKLTYNDKPINIYTGYTIDGSNGVFCAYDDTSHLFYPIYEILWQWTNISNTSFLAICHEMPFTVITNNCLSWSSNTNEYSKYRSLSDKSALIGSHTNQIDKDENSKGMYWLSRLLEYRKVTLCLGGHKHTYASTYPVRENYLYQKDGQTKWSYKDGPMDMPQSLKDDTAVWKIEITISTDTNSETKTINLTKFPIIKRQESHIALDINPANIYTYDYDGETMQIKVSAQGTGAIDRFYPYVDAKSDDNNPFVIYLMCQATGYKLTSNKELPSEFQKFSMIIPKSYISKISGKTTTDKPSTDQQMPMFTIVDIKGDNFYDIQLGRINKIFNSTQKFTQLDYDSGTNNQRIEYLIIAKNTINGLWAYYNRNENAFIQTDIFRGSNGNPVVFPDQTKISDNEFKFTLTEENKKLIMYPDLLSENNIYLFKVSSSGMLSE